MAKEETAPDPVADLNGKTILRFAHAYETGGGTERYLDDLDRTLLARNEVTIVYVHLTRRAGPLVATESVVGRGRMIRVPLPVRPGNAHRGEPNRKAWRPLLARLLRDWVIYNPALWRTAGARWAARRVLRPQSGEAIGAGAAVRDMLSSRRVDLAFLHFFGGADADEIMAVCRAHRVPVGLLNHYSNDRFLHLAIRKHAMAAEGVAGVNGLDVPRYLRGNFTNLSDGIDTEFFLPEKARPLPALPRLPVVLLPARVVPEKGQMDLVRTAARLKSEGHPFCVALAGRAEATSFVDELRAEVARAGLVDEVLFLGDLTVDQLRDWYAASAAVAFPTYHHEGLGRIIVEAQAMRVPVVAYATGGVAEGIEDGVTGCLLATGDQVGLGRRLRELLEAPGLRQTMGRAGRAFAENRFSLAALAERHERFYCRLMAVGSKAQPVVS